MKWFQLHGVLESECGKPKKKNQYHTVEYYICDSTAQNELHVPLKPTGHATHFVQLNHTYTLSTNIDFNNFSMRHNILYLRINMIYCSEYIVGKL